MKYKGSYYSREERQKFLYTNFHTFLVNVNKILDVGCDKKLLKKILYKNKKIDIKYFGIDLFGEPDVKCSLELGIPFKDECFDTVICLDVLEHIENIHMLFDELCRVSKKYVIISLPNTLSLMHIGYFIMGKSYSGKYGLPSEKPGDRHRWFFTIYQARNFVYNRARKNNFSVIKEFYFYRTQGKLKYITTLMKHLNLMPHLFADAYWCVLQKNNNQ